MDNSKIVNNCRILLDAYGKGELGQTNMPEDSSPEFKPAELEERLAYFTLPMALNYQRNSYKLWVAALETYKDPSTKNVFDVLSVSKMTTEELRTNLTKYKLALQPNKHVATWQKISQTVASNWDSLEGLLEAADYDFLKLKQLIQGEHKKGFPYLSGEKIFHYWCLILNTYCNCELKNSEYIEIAPDTHITKCSVLLGVISESEALSLSKAQINERWRDLLEGSGITPIQMHSPLWFWSRNGFIFKV